MSSHQSSHTLSQLSHTNKVGNARPVTSSLSGPTNFRIFVVHSWRAKFFVWRRLGIAISSAAGERGQISTSTMQPHTSPRRLQRVASATATGAAPESFAAQACAATLDAVFREHRPQPSRPLPIPMLHRCRCCPHTRPAGCEASACSTSGWPRLPLDDSTLRLRRSRRPPPWRPTLSARPPPPPWRACRSRSRHCSARRSRRPTAA